MPLQSRCCYVCNAPDEVDRHHVIPVEYGGPRNGKTVDLCTRHHRLVHRAAESYYKKGVYTANFLRIDPNSEERKRAEILVKYIIRAKGEHEASGKALADDARNMVQISCTPEELMIFHAVKQQLCISSLPRAIKALVLNHYYKTNGVKNADSKHLRKPPANDKRGKNGPSQVRDKTKRGRQSDNRRGR